MSQPSVTSVDQTEVEAVSKAIQSAAWRMNLTAFCEALGWEDDSYAQDKFSEFQALARALARFDPASLTKLAQP